jgi:RimJ/RimL family protein N-acetyltransferase/acyl carrier protein
MTMKHDHTLQGRVARLRPVLPEDLEFIYTVSVCEQNGFRWRYRGEFPDPGTFSRDHDKGTLLQMLVVCLSSSERAGIVNLYAENLRDGWAYLGALAAPEFQQTGVVIEGAAILLDYAFNLWPFRKIYLETIEYNLSAFEAGLRRVACEEGRLRDHVFFGQRYWDVVTSAIYRDSWRDLRAGGSSTPADRPCDVVPFEEFHRLVAAELDISTASPESRLLDDLGIDSLRMAELVVAVCDLADAPDPDEFPALETLGDVHRWYLSLCRHPADQGARLP